MSERHIGDITEMLREYRQAWLEWLQTNESLAIEQWLLAYADARPKPTESEDSEAICGYIDQRMRAAAEEIKRLREERDEARILACAALASGGRDFLNDPYLFKDDWRKPLAHDAAAERGWDCFKETP